MIGILVVLVILAFIYMALPLWVKLVICLINSMVVDPIPVLDEVFMIVSAISDMLKICKFMTAFEWMCKHKILLICIILVAIAVIVVASFMVQKFY